MKLRTITAPAYWASALINGDQSGMTTAEVITMNAWLKSEIEPGESIVGTADDSEPYFTHRCLMHDGSNFAGDVIEYQILGRD